MDITNASTTVRKATRRLPFSGTFRFLNLALLAAVIGLGTAAYLTVSSVPAKANPTVRTGTVSRGVVLSSVSATGSVVAPQDLGVDFATSGQLTEIDAKQGEKVQKGAILGRLDQTAASQAVQEAQANLATAEATLAATRAGATPTTKRQDSISMKQSSAAIAQAKVGVTQAQQNASMDAKTQTLSLANAERQLRTDRGNEAAYVTAVTKDNAAVAADQTAYNTATAAVSADNGRIAGDKAGLQNLTNTQNSLSLGQTEDNQQLTADKATLAAQTTASDKAHWQAIVNDDQNKVNSDAIELQQNSNAQSTLTYQESQDETALSDDTKTQSDALSTLNTDQATLKSDQASITSFESKIVADKQSVASAKLEQQTTTLKDRQSTAAAKQGLSTATLSAQATAVGNEVKEAPATASTLAQQEAAVLQAQASLTSAQLTFSQTVLQAPVAGTVAAVAGVTGQIMSAGGVSQAAASSSSSSSTSASPFVTLIGVTSMEATASFAESDAAKLKVGQASTVTIPALSNKELPAHVVDVDEVGSSSSSVVQYTVTVALDRNDAELKPGMTANVSIVTAERDNVLTVPSSAVTGSGSNATVKVVDAKGTQTVTRVVAGLVGDSTTEIVSGLKAGQTIVTSTVSSSLTSSSSNSTGLGGGGGAAVFGGGGGTFRRVGG
ncbi:MAG TPA: biotin/lipoyl-binding protein [Gaiellaceae bacterium]|jgi:multidrug efflux pump subunit AcrA (membrane-fusion protein)